MNSFLQDYLYSLDTIFTNIIEINKVPSNWRPSPKDQAEYIVKGLIRQVDNSIKSIVQSESRTFGQVKITTNSNIRSWEIDHHPAISISIDSGLVAECTLSQKAPTLEKLEDWIGKYVYVAPLDFSKRLDRILPEMLKIHRNRLNIKVTHEITKKMINQAADTEPVLVLESGNEYPLSFFRPVILLEDLETIWRKRFPSNEANSYSSLSPGSPYL
jgi:hypothetical protein